MFDEPWWRRTNHSGIAVSPRQTFGAIVDGSPEDSSVGVLILFSTATGGQILSKSSNEASRVEQAMQWLRRIHGNDVPDPICARSIDWSADPFSLGGYAGRRGIGGWRIAPDLFSPLGKLHFAGTETAKTWRSFMEGALQSGVRAADEVLATRG
jgi:monoamine oxidase